MANKPQPWEDFDPTTATASAPWEDFDPYEGVPKVPESENPAITGGKPSTERFAHPDDGIHFNPKAATGAMGIAEMAAPLFQKRAEEGGWGINPDTAGVFGANVFGEGNKYAGALKPVADLPVALADVAARAVQGGMYGVETAGDLLNKAAEHFGLNKLLSVNGNEFQPGSIAPALAEAFPLFGAESGISHAPSVPHLPSEAEAAYKQLLNHGTKDEIKGFFADKPGFNVDAATVDKYVEARDAHKNVSDDVQYQGVPSTPEYPQIPQGEIKNDTNRPYTPEEQAIADKLNAEKAGFKPTTDPTADELFAPKQKATTKEFETKLEADARAFQAAKAEPEAPPVAPEHVSAIDAKASEVKNGWTNAPEHNVYSSLDDIKDPAVRAAAEKGEAMDRPAFYGPDGQVYLNATKLTPEEVPAAIFHESLGHYGLAQQFRGDLDNVLRAMYDTNVGKYRLAADQWAKENKDAYGGKVTPERALEEVLAEESEKGVINSTVLDRIKNVVKRRAREMGLKMAFSDREITSILADAHRQVTHGVKAETAPGDIRTMYIGVNSRDLQKEDRFGPGIPGLADHVYDFMDDTDLQHAEGRFDPVELRDRYGLHQGPEGGIRSEITDHAAKIKPEVEWDTVPSGERLPLGDVLDHPDLFRNYPDLKDVIVTRQAPPAGYEGVQGWTHEGTINVSPNARKPLSTLLHEVQHIIQDKEGWLSGGSTDNVLKSMNPNQLNRLVSEALKPLKEDLEHFKSEGTPQGDRWAKSVQKDIDDILNAKDVHELGKLLPEDLIHKAYQNMFGEIEARDTQARQDLTPDQRRAVLPYSNANDVAVEDLVRTRQPGGPAMSAEAPAEDIKPMRKREEYVKAGVNTRYLATANDITNLLEEMNKSYRPNEPRTFATVKQKAREYALDPNKIAKGLGVKNLDAKVHAYEMIVAQAMDDMAGLMKEMGDKPVTRELQQQVMEKSAFLSTLRAGLLNDKAEIARATRAMAMMKATAGKTEEFFAVINKLGGDTAALADPGVFLKFMEEFKALTEKGDTKAASTLLAKPLSFSDKVVNAAINAVNLPRSLMASFDLSAPFRQGFFLIGSRNFYRAWGPMLKQFASEKAYVKAMEDIKSGPAYPLMKKAGLDLSDIGRNLSSREEQFVSQWAEKIPLVGIGVKASERAYTGFLNKLRSDTFNQLVVQSQRAGIDLESNSKALKDIASFVNAATGRGNLGSLNQSATALTTLFFSPRLIASRVQLLNPLYYAKLSPVVRKQAVKSLISSGIIAATVAGLAKTGGADIEADPRSSDFMKIRKGDTRYDVLGGFGQYITLGARLATNETKSLKGDVKELGTDFPFDTRLDVVGKFATNKFSPAASFVADYLRGQNAVGQEFNLKDETISRFIPLLAQDSYAVMKEYGMTEGAVRSIPSIFGVGVQNFDPNSSAFQYKPPSSHFKADGKTVSLSGDKYSQYRDLTKNLFEEGMKTLTSSPKWAGADIETKKAAVKELNAEIREEARDRLIKNKTITSKDIK